MFRFSNLEYYGGGDDGTMSSERSVTGPMMNAIIASNANLFKSQSANLNNRS